jgi:hypothetical protein
MKSATFDIKADSSIATGIIITQIDSTTIMIDQNVCIFLFVFLSSHLIGRCSRTAKKNVSKNGADTQKRYLKKKYARASIATINNRLIKNSLRFSTLELIIKSFLIYLAIF